MTMSKALQNLYKAITGEPNSKVNISKLLVDIHYAITGKETAVKNNRTKIINSMADNWPEGGGGGSSDLFSQVATVIASVPASENTGTFSNGSAEIAVTSFDSTGNYRIFIDSVTIEVNGQTETLNNFPLGGRAVPAVFDDGATWVVPTIVYIGDTSYIRFDVYDTTSQRTDSITVKASAFNIYIPTDAIVAIYPTLLNSGDE